MGRETIIGPVPDEWKATTLGEIVEQGGGHIQTGPFGSLLHASDYVSNGIPLELTITARRINEEQPEYVVKLILDVIKELKLNYNDVKIAILGLAFRGDIGDSRVTPVHDILRGYVC